METEEPGCAAGGFALTDGPAHSEHPGRASLGRLAVIDRSDVYRETKMPGLMHPWDSTR